MQAHCYAPCLAFIPSATCQLVIVLLLLPCCSTGSCRPRAAARTSGELTRKQTFVGEGSSGGPLGTLTGGVPSAAKGLVRTVNKSQNRFIGSLKKGFTMYPSPRQAALLVALVLKRVEKTRARVSEKTVKLICGRTMLRDAFLYDLRRWAKTSAFCSCALSEVASRLWPLAR